jgi:hypothetical protein
MKIPHFSVLDQTSSFPQKDLEMTATILMSSIEKWGDVILSPHPLTIELTIEKLSAGVALSRSEFSVQLKNHKHETLLTSVAAYKLAFGTDLNGDAPDIKIAIDANFLRNYLGDERQGAICGTFIHELAHSFFQTGKKHSGGLYATRWGTNLVESAQGPLAGGHHTIRLAGEPVPLWSDGLHLDHDFATRFNSGLGPRGSYYCELAELEQAMASDNGLPTALGDIFFAARKNGALDGNGGVDTIFINDQSSSYDVFRRDTDWIVKHRTGEYEIELRNMEYVLFSNEIMPLYV